MQASSPAEGYRQLLVFPEGTTTNGRALVHFKSGCFRSGVPVQPVLARFAGANRPDTLTWTWGQGYGILGCTWLTMCMINTTVTVRKGGRSLPLTMRAFSVTRWRCRPIKLQMKYSIPLDSNAV